MDSIQTNGSNKKTFYIIITSVLVLLLTGTGLYFLNLNINEDTKKQEDSSLNTAQKDIDESLEQTLDNDQKVSQVSSLQSGTFKGSKASLLTNALVFPVSTININQDKTFVFEATGLDLSLLGLEQLKLDGKFPKVSAIVAGSIVESTVDNSFDFNSTSLDVNFTIDNIAVNPAEKTKLIAALANLNLVIPEVSPEKPAILNADIEFDGNSLKINSTKNSTLVVTFAGKKI